MTGPLPESSVALPVSCRSMRPPSLVMFSVPGIPLAETLPLPESRLALPAPDAVMSPPSAVTVSGPVYVGLR